MLARKGHRSFSFSFFFSFLWEPGFLRLWIFGLPLFVVSLSLKRSLDSYQPIPILHEAPKQDSQNPKSIATHALDRAQRVCMARWLAVGYHTVALATLKS
jgi:hypothetical protein